MNQTDRAEIAVLATKIDRLADDMKEVREDVEEIRAQANRWKGAFAAVLGFGAAVGFLVSNIGEVRKWLTG